MDDDFDLDEIRIGNLEQIRINLPKPVSKRLPRHELGEEFLKGPIPANWLKRAACLPGQAISLGLAVWFIAGIRKTRTVALSLRKQSEWGLTRFSAYRALKELERAGLVKAERRPGSSIAITLLDADAHPARTIG